MERGADLKRVAAGCRAAGATVVVKLETLDMLVLDASAEEATAFKSLPDVASVEPGHDVGIS